MRYKNYIKLFIVNIIIFFVVIIFYIFSPGPSSKSHILIVTPNMKSQDMIYMLQKHNIIAANKLPFFIMKFYFSFFTYKSGEYLFKSNISLFQTLKIISQGKSIIHKLVIPEGITVDKVVNMINNINLLVGQRILSDTLLEGSLMPDTYFYSYGDKKEDIINKMLLNMSNLLDDLYKNLPQNFILKNKLDILILASIIEKETKFSHEKPIIASVFINRLNKNMRLQSDPTTIYSITYGKGSFGRSLTRKDLLTRSYYNTYYVTGLPLGPICCPGIESIKSVINYEKTDYLYFVYDHLSQKHIFSVSLNYHLKHIKKIKNQLK